MKPHKIFLFFIAVLAALALLMIFFPKNGIKITDDFVLQFQTWDEFWNPVKNKDISDIVESNKVDDTVTFVEQDNYDSVYIDSVLVVYKPVNISVDSNLQHLEFPENNDTLLNNLFSNFGAIRNTNNKIHILHYGDSQIEVDRMTSYFRYKLQSTFGGNGCGFHQGLQAFNFKQPLIVSYSDNWTRYKVFPKKDSLVTHKRFGISTSFSKFIPIKDTSLLEEQKDTLNPTQEQTAWIKFEKSPVAYSNVRKFQTVTLFYGFNNTEVKVELFDGENSIISDVLSPNEQLQAKTWVLQNPTSVKFVFTGTSSPEIYGYSFESQSGVMVDNIPIRGSAGMFFGRIDFSIAAKMYAILNARLFLLQFGGNALSKDSARIKNYVEYYGNQMSYLKRMNPEAEIIVIGPADMAEKKKNSYVTRETLPYMIELMKAETLKNNCVFWNTYEAMGGKNSMSSWVFHDPPLAETDFIHFTPKGANIIAQMFYKALIWEYNEFLKKQSASK